MKVHEEPNMKASLIISTYNWEQALNLVLISVLHQTVLPHEVIIADDGSKKNTKELIDFFRKTFPIPLIHIWHEDNGFRLAEIRNKAIKAADGDYIIQIDGDVILHKHFIKDHLKLAEKNCFVTGSRALISKVNSQKIIEKQITKLSSLSKGISNRHKAIHLPAFNLFSKPRNSPLSKMSIRIRGCNMAFWKQDLIEINGYNNDFIGWGREDSDIVVRLIKKGCYRKKITFAAIQFHIYHKENSRDNLEKNHIEALKTSSYYVKNGISIINS